MEENKTKSTQNPPMGGRAGGRMGGMGRGMAMGAKPKNFKKSIAKLSVYAKKYWAWVLVAILFSVGATVIQLINPNKLGEITNLISSPMFALKEMLEQGQMPVWLGIDLGAVASVAILLICLLATSIVINYLQGFIMATVTQKVTKKLRSDISQKINRLPLKYIDGTPYGDVLSRVTNDVDTIGQTLSNSITSLVSSITLLGGVIIMMFVTNWIMALAAIASSILGFVLMGVIMAKSQKYFIEQQKSLGQLNGQIEEIYSGHNVVKVSNANKETQEAFAKINNELYNSAWKSQFLSGLMMPIMTFVGNLSYVVVCVVGASLLIGGILPAATGIGTIVSFIIYARFFSQPLGQLAQVLTGLQSTAAASERVFDFLEEKELENESYKTQSLTDIKGNVEFKEVRFGYNPDKEIIKGFSAKIKAGQKVAIVGPTGAGKTTMVNLLMRFYDVNSGEILIDGTPISQLTRENVHNFFSMVLQDTWMFEGTVMENIVYSKEGVTLEQVKEACKACGIHHFIKTLPKGYNSVLDDNTNISAGQKQLLTIARAMVQNSPLLILDEATSSVDTRTEILIQKAMDNLTKGRTSFVIAHRLSTIKNADLILVMKDGDIVEQGNHNKLIKENGFYAELYNSQFEQV